MSDIKQSTKIHRLTKKVIVPSYATTSLYNAHNQIKLYANSDGTRLALMPNKSDASSISIYFYFKIGSKFETEELNGISHYVEHMVYKGASKLKTYFDISRPLDAAGVTYNAFTAKDMTAYMYKFLATDENIDLICKITTQMLFHSLFREKDINLERTVIIQEYNDGIDDIDNVIDDIIDVEMFKGHPLGMTIIGDRKSLSNINRRELIDFCKKHYTLDKLLIGVSGSIPANFLNIIEHYFKKFKPIDIKTAHPTTLIPFTDNQTKYNLKLIPRSLEQDYINIIFKTGGFFDNNNNKYKLIQNVLGVNMSSRLFVEVREKLGLVYTIKCQLNNYEEIGTFVINMQCEAKNTVKCIDKVLQELVKIVKYGITDIELKENKKNFCDSIISNFEDIQVKNEYYCKQILFNKAVVTIKEKVDAMQALTLHDIKQGCEELFNFNKMNIIWFGKAKLKHIDNIVKKYC
jgi:predicted Zn-dependent peptidase